MLKTLEIVLQVNKETYDLGALKMSGNLQSQSITYWNTNYELALFRIPFNIMFSVFNLCVCGSSVM